MYRIFFYKLYARWLEELLPLSIEVTSENSSTFTQWYLCVTNNDKIELNIGKCEFHECNVSTTIWRSYLDSSTINTKYFDGDQIITHK